MKAIKDPVHGYIEVDEFIEPVLDSALVQRQRYLHQLGFAYLVYPGANHTRFEHAIGTMHLAGRLGRKIGLSQDDNNTVITAALLHDVGHGPFSHSSEELMRERIGREHTLVNSILSDDPVSKILEESCIDPAEVISLLEGNHRLSSIIKGDLDVDRMDYLPRDAHYTGVPYGTVDTDRLIRTSMLTDRGLVLSENGINAAEALLIARTLMRPSVYFHHVSRIAERMWILAADIHLRAKETDYLEKFFRMDDIECIQSLRGSHEPVSMEISKKIMNRELYKRALYIGYDQVFPDSVAKMQGYLTGCKIAEKIAERASVPVSDVIVDIPHFPVDMKMQVEVENNDSNTNLESLSPLLSTLNATRRAQWRLGVYTPAPHRISITSAAHEELPVRPLTRQERLFQR